MEILKDLDRILIGLSDGPDIQKYTSIETTFRFLNAAGYDKIYQHGVQEAMYTKLEKDGFINREIVQSRDAYVTFMDSNYRITVDGLVHLSEGGYFGKWKKLKDTEKLTENLAKYAFYASITAVVFSIGTYGMEYLKNQHSIFVNWPSVYLLIPVVLIGSIVLSLLVSTRLRKILPSRQKHSL